MTTPIKVEQVTQADRDAAADYLGYGNWDDATDYRLSGKEDDRVRRTVQAFAAHRIAAEAKTREEDARLGFAPCPTCKQYSHSLGEDEIADAFNHFQSMFSHRGDGIPTQHNFDERTRDAAQVLMAAIRSRIPETDR